MNFSLNIITQNSMFGVIVRFKINDISGHCNHVAVSGCDSDV